MDALDFLAAAASLITGGVKAAAKRLSALNFAGDRVEVRNFPGRTRRIPLGAIDRFDGAFLLLTNGSRLRIRRLGERELAGGVTGLNNRLEHMRHSAVGE